MRSNGSRHGARLGLLLALVGLLAATVCPAWAKTGTYRVVILRVFYTDFPTSHYTDGQISQAAGEINDYFAMLSNGNLDVQVSVAKATLSHSKNHYWSPCPNLGECPSANLIRDAAEAAYAGGFDFTGVDGIVLLNPFGGGPDWTTPPVAISTSHVNGTFQQAYDHESFPGKEYRLFAPPGPSGVWWGAWVHEIGHQLEFADGTDLGGNWMGHPSGYMSGYDLMDSCYPCGESAYGLSGPPVMNGSRRVFPDWLPPGKVKTVDPFVKPAIVVLSPLSLDPSDSKSYQAIKVPKFASDFPNEYYLVQARVRDRADGRGTGIWDEGVEILDVDEWRDPPVKPMYPCDYVAGPDFPCISDFDTDPRAWNCYSHPPDGQGPAIPPHAGVTPSYCWPHPLWQKGQSFTCLPYGNVQIRVDDMVEKGYVVSVTGGAGANVPDVFIIPWHTLPMETNETVDIWIDSSINGYEDDLGPTGLRYGRRPDGTVIGNGDDPSLNHENRIYARVHNGGDGPAKNVRVKFYALDPSKPGVIIGTQASTLVGEATETEFPAIQSLDPGKTATVYVTWKPVPPSVKNSPVGQGQWGVPASNDSPVGQWGIPAFFYNFPTSVKVVIEPVEGELVTSNQEAREDFGTVEAVKPPFDETYLTYDPFFWIKNPWPDPHTFFVDIRSKLPSQWTYGLGDIAGSITLAAGEEVVVPVQVTIPSGGAAAEALSLRSKRGERERNLLTVNVRTLVTQENLAAPPESPYRTHWDAMAIGSMVLEVLPVQETKFALEVWPDMMGVIVAAGRLDPFPGKGSIALDYTDPSGNSMTRLLKLQKEGRFEDRFSARTLGSWTVQAVRAGDLNYSGAVSDVVSVDLQPDSVTTAQGTIGTRFDLAGLGFGESKPKVFAEYEAGGLVRRKQVRVEAWTETSVTCLWTLKLAPGTYNLLVQRRPGEWIPVGTFTVMAPVIRNVVPPSGKAGTPIAASGLFFSSTRPTVYLQNPATKKRTACRVTNGDMNPATGASTLAFLVPELNPGSYDLVLKNAIGEALSSFSVSSR